MIYAFSIPNARRNRRNGTTFEGDTPYWYAVLRGVDGTQYAKGWYAVRINSVISYADINLLL